jgi:hypothetical protein
VSLDPFLDQLADAIADRVAGRLNGHLSPPAAGGQGDRLLSADEVAQLLGVSRRWAYDHFDVLGGRRLSRRCVRFSAAAVERRLGATASGRKRATP